MERIVAFGDSWSAGYCGDLYQHISNFHEKNVIEFKDNAWHFSMPWPNILAKMLNLNALNLSLSGCQNKSMVAMLYDSFILGDLDPKKDYVILLFSTWHREAMWSETIDLTFNSKVFKDTCFTYESFSKFGPGIEVNDTNYRKKLAAEMFLNFYEAINFLEKNNFNYKIGWGFTFVEDFQTYVDKKYIDVIKNNPNLINPMVNYCKSFKSFENLMHPTQEDHKGYAKYLYKILKNERL